MRGLERRAAVIALVILVGTLIWAPAAVAVPGDITLASTSDAGVKSDGFVGLPSLSADGTKVAFESSATNLDPADADDTLDVYVKDLVTGDITLASTSDGGVKGDAPSGLVASLSADGTRVAFRSLATNLDPADADGLGDVYVKDLVTGDITLVSTSDGGTKGDGDSGFFGLSLSADGTRVAFHSESTNLDPADTDSGLDVYVKDLVTGDITLASTSDAGVKGDGATPTLSADGTTVAFSSFSNLEPADTDFDKDAYVKDLLTGNVTLVSISAAGIKGNGQSGPTGLSADGTKVAFDSAATNLDPVDTDSLEDVYVKDLVSGDLLLPQRRTPGRKGTWGGSSGSFQLMGRR